MNENPNYYSVIPAEVRYDKRLTANAKLLYAEITALTNMNGKCFATNEYFSKLYGVSKNSITNWIKQLCDYKYIQSEIIYKEGTKEILCRYTKILGYPTQKILDTPTQKICEDNNTTKVEYNINTTYNNISTISNLDDNADIKVNLNDKGSSSIIVKKSHLIGFLEFWKYYTPIKSKDGHFVAKGNKQECLKKYVKLLKEGVKHETIIGNLEKYLRYCQENGYSSCGAEVYLNQRRFENDYSGIECVDSKARDIQRGSVNYAKIAAELARESLYDDKDCIPF